MVIECGVKKEVGVDYDFISQIFISCLHMLRTFINNSFNIRKSSVKGARMRAQFYRIKKNGNQQVK